MSMKTKMMKWLGVWMIATGSIVACAGEDEGDERWAEDFEQREEPDEPEGAEANDVDPSNASDELMAEDPAIEIGQGEPECQGKPFCYCECYVRHPCTNGGSQCSALGSCLNQCDASFPVSCPHPSPPSPLPTSLAECI